MKKVLSIVIALLLALSLFACSTEDAQEIIDILDEVSEQTEAKEEQKQEELILIEDEPTDEKQDEEEPAPEAPAEPSEPTPEPEPNPEPEQKPEKEKLDEFADYSSKDDVALYISQYDHLPPNFITKNQARKEYGWNGGGLPDGMSIGGDYFGNREGLLPEAEDREYTECDIDTTNADSRGAKRIVFSNDGLIFYTDDHYKTFTQLFPEG